MQRLESLMTCVQVLEKSLPNIGREGETYLNHIVGQYQNLADHQIFVQGGIEMPENLPKKLVNLSHVAVSNLGGQSICTCQGGCYMEGPMIPLLELHTMITGEFCHDEEFSVFLRGQFIVSGSRIRARSLSLYSKLLDRFPKSDQDAAKDTLFKNITGIRRRQFDIASEPIFGHAIERGWSIIFDCYDPKTKPNICYE